MDINEVITCLMGILLGVLIGVAVCAGTIKRFEYVKDTNKQIIIYEDKYYRLTELDLNNLLLNVKEDS